MTGCDDCAPKDLTHASPAYKKALWIVVLLNICMGIIEMTVGFIASSQSLKADALDFLGDGIITFVGLLSIGWSAKARSRTALLQGYFLAGLGVCVLLNAFYRFASQVLPEADMMGGIGFIALGVNVAAVLVIRPYREGDASTRAIWLFSRNDALNNIAVMVAAGLVALTQTAWPDLIVAIIIAGVFLHSAYDIIKHAREEEIVLENNVAKNNRGDNS
jgi:Co/Zn/Cd efflux system component